MTTSRKLVFVIAGVCLGILLGVKYLNAAEHRPYAEIGGIGLTEKGISEGHKAYYLVGAETIWNNGLSSNIEGFTRGEAADDDPEILQWGAAAGARYMLGVWEHVKPYLEVSYNHYERDVGEEDTIYFAAANGGALFTYGIFYVDIGTIIPFWSNTQSGNFGIDSGIGIKYGAFDIGYRYKEVRLTDHHFSSDNEMAFTFSGVQFGYKF